MQIQYFSASRSSWSHCARWLWCTFISGLFTLFIIAIWKFPLRYRDSRFEVIPLRCCTCEHRQVPLIHAWYRRHVLLPLPTRRSMPSSNHIAICDMDAFILVCRAWLLLLALPTRHAFFTKCISPIKVFGKNMIPQCFHVFHNVFIYLVAVNNRRNRPGRIIYYYFNITLHPYKHLSLPALFVVQEEYHHRFP